MKQLWSYQSELGGRRGVRATGASHTPDVPYATSSASGDHDAAGADGREQ